MITINEKQLKEHGYNIVRENNVLQVTGNEKTYVEVVEELPVKERRTVVMFKWFFAYCENVEIFASESGLLAILSSGSKENPPHEVRYCDCLW